MIIKPCFITAALFVVCPFFFVSPSNNPANPLIQLYSLGHFFFFALLAWSLSRLPVLTRESFVLHSAFILLAIVGIGGAFELIQPFWGRTASWKDMGINIAGALAGLLFSSPGRTGLNPKLLKGFQALILAWFCMIFYDPVITLYDMHQASKQFPILSDFETRFQHKRWSNGKIVHHLSRYGEASLLVHLDHQKQYPGTTLIHSFGNWRGYSTLALSIYNPSPDPLKMFISIRDLEHSLKRQGIGDRFDKRFEILQGWNDLLIPVADIATAPKTRMLNLGQLSSVVIFTMNLLEPSKIYIDHVRLI